MNNKDISRQTDKIKQQIERAKKVKSEELAKAILHKAFSLRKSILLAGIVMGLSACGTMSSHLPTDNGRIIIDADAKGMQAFGDVLNGMVTNGKASPDKDTAHWQLRKKQAREETVQQYAPSFLEGIFSSEKSSLPVSKESVQPSEPSDS